MNWEALNNPILWVVIVLGVLANIPWSKLLPSASVNWWWSWQTTAVLSAVSAGFVVYSVMRGYAIVAGFNVFALVLSLNSLVIGKLNGIEQALRDLGGKA